MADPESQTDPTFKTTKLYCRLTGKEARRRLTAEHGYAEDRVPSARTLRRKLTAMGFHPMKVRKSKPLKKTKETNAIFEALAVINAAADADPGVVRISLDTKTPAPIGNLSRGGKSRIRHQALDHDMEPDARVTPFGIMRPDTKEVRLAFTTGSVSADFMADRAEEIWPLLKKNGNTPQTIVINADNGPENSGSRTQWLLRMAVFCAKIGVKVILAYYPPYHSKYNPVERVFGVLENYWNGTPLLTVEHAKGMAAAMTYAGLHPKVSEHEGREKGRRLLPKAMKVLEEGLERLDGLRKWVISITPEKAKAALEKLLNSGLIQPSQLS